MSMVSTSSPSFLLSTYLKYFKKNSLTFIGFTVLVIPVVFLTSLARPDDMSQWSQTDVLVT